VVISDEYMHKFLYHHITSVTCLPHISELCVADASSLGDFIFVRVFIDYSIRVFSLKDSYLSY